MTRDKTDRQVARWVEEKGATAERVQNYGERAGSAFDQLVELSGAFADSFNKNNQRRVKVSRECAGKLVLTYNRHLINFKRDHGISIEDRVDTHICAGLWFCAIVQEPLFGCDDAAAKGWDMATQEQLNAYYRLQSNFAFYYSFQILRGHYKKYDELYLLNVLQPIRKYMADHYEVISSSPAASVGIFLTISVFDEDCKAPSILS